MAETGTTTSETPEPTTEQPQAGSVTPALFDEGKKMEATEPGQESEKEPEGGEPEKAETEKPLTKEDIAVPEGFTYDDELGKGFLDIVNDAELSRKELAEKLVEMYSAQQGKMMESLAAADKARTEQFEAEMKREKEDWMKQCQADSEYGGQNWEAAQSVIDRGCRQIATPEAVTLMQRYNLNTHPEIVRMFYRAGKLAGEDRGGGSGASGGKLDPAEAMFGESLKNWKTRGA